MKKADALVIGGGVVGSAILHKLSAYAIDAVLVEKEPDLCEGTSKANNAILHTGFDEPLDSIESECLIRSQELWPRLINDHHLAYEERGAVMVAFDEEEKQTIHNKYIKNAKGASVDVRWISREEVLKNNPAVNPDCIGGLLVEKEGIVNPFEATYSFAEVAVQNGAEVMLNRKVTAISSNNDGFVVSLDDDTHIEAGYVINAAGLYSDQIARMIGDTSFYVDPRKGQFIVTKDPVGISNIILPVPSPNSKGKLVTPAVFGGHLLGPTAENISDKEDKATNEEGFQEIMDSCTKLVPESIAYTTVKQYAGLRAVSSEGDYILRPSEANERMIHVAGIRSTGLSASPGIAEKVIEELQNIGADWEEKTDWEADLAKLQPAELDVSEEVVCLCNYVTKKDVVNALNRPIVPHSMDAMKRRTEALLGSCQGGCCVPKIIDVMEEQWELQGIPIKGNRGTDLAIQHAHHSF